MSINYPTAPEDAQVHIDCSYYKLGRGGLPFRWTGTVWVMSSKPKEIVEKAIEREQAKAIEREKAKAIERRKREAMSKPTIPEVMPLVREYYAIHGNGAGGRLHIVLEDGNIENGHIEWCLNKCADHGDATGVELCNLLLKMSKTQRKKICRNRGSL